MTLEQWIEETNAAELGGVQAAEFVHMAGVAQQHNTRRSRIEHTRRDMEWTSRQLGESRDV